MAIVYVIAQFIGAFMGYGLLTVLIPAIALESSGPSFCVTKPRNEVTIPQAFCIEFIATGTLVWFCCGVWDPRNAKNQDSIAIRFALAFACLVSATANFTGGSESASTICSNTFLNKILKLKNYRLLKNYVGLNPARSLGPALCTGDFEAIWVSINEKTATQFFLLPIDFF